MLEAYHAKVPMMMRLPDFAGMSETAHEVIRLYDRERHRDHAYYFGGHDARMCARSFYAQAQWGQGLLDQAKATSVESIEDARDARSLFSRWRTPCSAAAITCVLLRDAEACRAIADELYPLAERKNFPGSSATRNFCAAGLPPSMEITKPASSRCSTPPTPNSPPGPFYRSFFSRLPSFSCAAERPIGSWPRSIAPST